MKKICVTGTFAVKRQELEDCLKQAGHEVADLSGKTDVLLVGEKTASFQKIQKARQLGLWILEETDPEKILSLLRRTDEMGYISFYDRGGEERFTAHPNQAISVFDDYRSRNADQGEWFPDQDGEVDYKSLISSTEYIAGYIREELSVDISSEEYQEFFRNFFRVLCLAVFAGKYSENDIPNEEKDIGYFGLRDGIKIGKPDFYKKFLDHFNYDEEEDKKILSSSKDVRALIVQYEEDEKKVFSKVTCDPADWTGDKERK